MRRGLRITGLMILMMVMVILATTAQAERIVVEPAAIAGLAPQGMGGIGLSARVAPLGEKNVQPRRSLWLDVAAVTRDLGNFGPLTGLSTEIRPGKPVRGGVGREWRDGLWLLYVTRSFETAF